MGLIREIHVASRGAYGYRRIHAELPIGMGIPGSSRLISVLMARAGIDGLPGPARIARLRGDATVDDLVNRKFHRLALNGPWVTDIPPQEGDAPSGHPLREGKIHCAAVLLAVTVNGLFKAECLRTSVFHASPYRPLADVEFATAGWVDWCLHGNLWMLAPKVFETLHCEALTREPEPAKQRQRTWADSDSDRGLSNRLPQWHP